MVRRKRMERCDGLEIVVASSGEHDSGLSPRDHRPDWKE
jgi:hypothetical protein